GTSMTARSSAARTVTTSATAPAKQATRSTTQARPSAPSTAGATYAAPVLGDAPPAETSPTLAYRAQELIARRSRDGIADGLARSLRSARRTTPGLTAAVPPHTHDLLQARALLAAL